VNEKAMDKVCMCVYESDCAREEKEREKYRKRKKKEIEMKKEREREKVCAPQGVKEKTRVKGRLDWRQRERESD